MRILRESDDRVNPGVVRLYSVKSTFNRGADAWTIGSNGVPETTLINSNRPICEACRIRRSSLYFLSQKSARKHEAVKWKVCSMCDRTL